MSSTSLSPGLQSSKQLTRITTVALAAIAYFALAIVALHVLRSADDPLRQTTSEYAVGSYGYVMTSAFLVVGLASVALIFGLYQGITPPARSRIGLGLLGLWVVGVLIAMTFPIDLADAPQTTSGVIHRINGPLTFLSLSIGAILVSRRLKHDANWRSVYPAALTLSVFMLATFIVTGVNIATDTGFAGLFQRIVLVTFVTWFVLMATRLHALANDSEPASAG